MLSQQLRTLVIFVLTLGHAAALSISNAQSVVVPTTSATPPPISTRRGFVTKSAAAFGLGSGAFLTAVTITTQAAVAAAPEVLTAANGKIKYATLTPPPAGKATTSPLNGDVVAIEYTGYLADGTIFDATHAQGKKKELMFQLGGNAVIPGVSEMVQEMSVGQKVQAIVSF